MSKTFFHIKWDENDSLIFFKDDTYYRSKEKFFADLHEYCNDYATELLEKASENFTYYNYIEEFEEHEINYNLIITEMTFEDEG